MTRPRAADDFATIRARLEEMRREREAVQAAPGDLQEVPTTHRPRTCAGRLQRWTQDRGGSAKPSPPNWIGMQLTLASLREQ